MSANADMAVKLGDVDPALLSEAIVVWTGKGEHAWPHRDESRVAARLGKELAVDLVPRIHVLHDEFYEPDARNTARDLQQMGDRAAAEFQSAIPS